ncbi:protein-glutamate O-methyltransferase CheR [Parasalinivibrio latis]|uniref:CheR family methyltransferase n=1 Tax=Parasalinivibrio latis TaxID=2952610 RepID=UPI0030DF8CFB
MNIAVEREFDFSKQDFAFIRELMLRETGISLGEGKMTMVYGRLCRRIRELGLSSFSQYFQLIDESKSEREKCVNALTTNRTQFFRESHHFSFLQSHLIPAWKSSPKPIRIWSAGCSTGEEPYSIASVLKHEGMLEGNWDISILATDLDTQVLEKAKKGQFPITDVKGIPEPFLKAAFVRGKGLHDGAFKAKASVQHFIRFQQLNLLHEWPFKTQFDVIFCRNVMIYFQRDTQQALLKRFYNHLHHNGALFIGHSESIGAVGSKLTNVCHTGFIKP